MLTRPCVIGQTTCQGKLYVMPLCLIFCVLKWRNIPVKTHKLSSMSYLCFIVPFSRCGITVISEIFARVLFSRNFAYEKFS